MQTSHGRTLKQFYHEASINSYAFHAKYHLMPSANNMKMNVLRKVKNKEKIPVYQKLENIVDEGEIGAVAPIQPRACCSRKTCILLLVWTFLFILGVLLLTLFVMRVLQKGTKEMVGRQFYSKYTDTDNPAIEETFLPCDDILIKKVWHTNFDKLQTETAVRFIDVNSDGIDDPIVAFGTGVDGYNVNKIVCTLYFNGTYPCYGGALAIDGKTGHELWRHYSGHEIYAVNCNSDIDKDGVPDCLLGGRGGIFDAVSGKDGHLLWAFWDAVARSDIMNLYTAQFIRDLDGDGVMEVLQIHGGDPLA